jgi:hypothetical protein
LAVEECVTLGGIVSAMHPHASADFARWRMTHRSLGVGGYGYWGPRVCPWGSMAKNLLVKVARESHGFRGGESHKNLKEPSYQDGKESL